jgi:hypothetical protein
VQLVVVVSLLCLVFRKREIACSTRRGWTQVIYQPVLLLSSIDTSQYNILIPEAYSHSVAEQFLLLCFIFLVGRKPISVVFLYHLPPCSCRSLHKMKDKPTRSSVIAVVVVVVVVSFIYCLVGW